MPRLRRRATALAACVLLGLGAIAPLTALTATPASAADDTITLTGDRVEYDAATRTARADGDVRVTGQDAVITADHLEANFDTQEIVATGNVTLTRGQITVTGTALRYNMTTKVGRFDQMVGDLPPWHLTGDAIEIGPQVDTAYGASITPCDPTRPLYKVTARKIEVVPNDHFTAYDASLWVAGVRVITVPAYTATVGRRSGPELGYNSLDGAYIQYVNSFPLLGWRDEYRIRLATATGLSAENIALQRFGDHIWSVDLGRSLVKDPNGNLFNLDRYSLDLQYDRTRIRGMPIDVEFEAHAGSYRELATGVSTTRAEALVTLTSDTFTLSPGLYFSASARGHFDVYGTGQQRTVLEGSTALSAVLSPRSSTSLAYSTVSVSGTTPFSFDAYAPSSAASLSYTYAFGGFVQSASVAVSYDFLAMQTTVGVSAAMSLSPNTVFNISAFYDVATQRIIEIDYALNVRCDCVTVGVVYQTFPQSGANALMLSVQINAFSMRDVFSGAASP